MMNVDQSRDEAIARLTAAVPAGKPELTADDLAALRDPTRHLVRVAGEAGRAELDRFRRLQHRRIILDPRAIENSHVNQTIVVTGGSGCIGSSLLAELTELQPARLVSISRGLTAPWTVVPGVEYQHVDIRDQLGLGAAFQAVRPDIVYHLAAQHHPGLAEYEVAHTLSTNVLGSANVFEASRRLGCQIVHASTGKALRPFSRDIYAASKKMSEWLLMRAIESGGLLGSAARFTHVVDNSIIDQRMRGWVDTHTPFRLHSPDSWFYLQSAREAAQLLIGAAHSAVPGELTVGAIRDLGWPVSLLDLAIGWLTTCQDPPPLYICGVEAGYDSSQYPALYDPRNSGDRSPLFNALEVPGVTMVDASPDVDICSVTTSSDPTTAMMISKLGHAASPGSGAGTLRALVEDCGWAMLKNTVATLPTATIDRHVDLVASLPRSAFDADDLAVVEIITEELGLRVSDLLQAASDEVLVAATVVPEQASLKSVASVSIGIDRPAADNTPAAGLDVDDIEKVSYFGPQARWYLIVRFLAFAGLLVSLLRFTYSDARISALLTVILPLAVVSLISLYTSTRRRRMSLDEHQHTVANWVHRIDPNAPSVDVFLPTAGEAIGVLRGTYERVAALHYPGALAIYVLDDGGRPEVEALAASYGFSYLCRPNRGHMKKAGNLAYGYAVSTGDVIAVFDADFAPRPDYLLELMPYLDDQSVGIVQSPQYFSTYGIESWLQRAAGATQELFYRWVQPSRDAIGAPICVGTCALYRRRALRASGGFAQIEHSEDVHTGIKMMGSGYQVRYVPVILAKGLCPDSLSAFISQQYRWCSGSMSLMVNAEFRAMPLTIKQRLCFWSGFGYFITTVLSAFAVLIPPIYLLWWSPQAIQAINYVWLIPAFLIYPLIMVVHRGDWRMNVLRAQLIYSYAHAFAIWDTYRGHTAEWVATGVVEKAPLSTKVIRLMVGWILVTQIALWWGIGHVAWYSLVPPGDLWPLVCLAVFAAYIQLPILVLGRQHVQLAVLVPGATRSMAGSR